MKSRKVLLGLIAGFVMCLSGTATAQKANFQSNQLVEIGPDNIGGRVTSLVVFNQQEDHVSTLYIGAATGGLYTRTSQSDDLWRYLPCYVDGDELTLPISSLLKLNDSMLVVATGENGNYTRGKNLSNFAALGRGLFLFNTNNETFTRINGTNPGFDLDANFASVSCMKSVTFQGTTYLFVATSKGLFRWSFAEAEGFSGNPTRVFEGNVTDLVLSKQTNRAFFSNEGYVYKISDIINGSEPVNISGSCSAFGGNAIKVNLALAPSDENYLYAMVSNNQGGLTGIYLTRNTNSWSLISSSTVTPFTITKATSCGAITVDPNDPSRIYIGGTDFWTGKGYVEGSPYQWSSLSMDEHALNGGDYMAMVFSNSNFVHSGIHQIVSENYWNEDILDFTTNYYILTDGGVYKKEGNRFNNFNHGLNNVQINDIAVCPDGSIISGANANACPFIESRNEHNGGANEDSWYDHSGSNTNHMANIIWKNNGGSVAASQFTQYRPISRRPIFVTSGGGSIGRSYGDFSNYTQTQTWTADELFTADQIDQVSGGPAIGQIYLWETDKNTQANLMVKFNIDTLSYVIRNGKKLKFHDRDTTTEAQHFAYNFQIKAGDSIMVLDPAHASYPFWYVFDHNFTLSDEPTHTVVSPYLSRLLAVANPSGNAKNSTVFYTWVPTDFRYAVNNQPPDNNERFWAPIYTVLGTANPNHTVRYTAISQDGDCAFVVVEDYKENKSFIARVHNLNGIDYTQEVFEIRNSLDFLGTDHSTVIDTIMVNDSSIYFGRRISSINVDPREGKDAIIITFDGYGCEGANVAYINNATNNAQISYSNLPTNIPVYSAMIEKTTGETYVGTEDGVFKTANITSPSWQTYGAFKGVPVTSMYQVTYDKKFIKHITHDGVAEVNNYFPSTKWSNAMYFGTYGRGIFMDTTYVVNHTNEIVPEEVYLDVPTISGNSENAVRFYPNPAVNSTTMELSISKAGNTTVVVYDLTGKVVYSQKLGVLTEGVHTHTIDCQNLNHGMYLVNVLVGNQKSASKLIVK